ncbi:serine hydrolase [Halomonas chromatireducens]|uniref:beta-lactamase n=1 Tax=Halomonas chromatireducens TaxID=507626 RepID=A0A109ULH0_9GAMM|nr:serine hydrolase [Halomonas chromatireducens]AMD00519.1 Beta-lactamase [Halomonas chromatireducens]
MSRWILPPHLPLLALFAFSLLAAPLWAASGAGWTDRLEASVATVPAWAKRLDARLALLEAGFDGELGVHIWKLDNAGQEARYGWRDREPWYLASLVKVPVAIELMARVEAGSATLDDRLVLYESHYVDGAGPTNWAAPGSELTLRELLEPMLTVSDNTASDMLIDFLGLDSVNRRAQSLVKDPDGLGPITTLVDVRRHVYRQLHPDAFGLTGLDFIELRKLESDEQRLRWLARWLGVAHDSLQLTSLDDAFQAYYATDLNAGRLDAFADLLAALGEGRALGDEATAELLAILSRTSSGERRLKAGMGRDIRFAHKTGTQHRRTCDAGIASQGEESARQRAVIVACTRGVLNVARSEQMLAAVGRALYESGVFLDAP